METEYEVKILDIDVKEFQQKLKELGAKKVGENLQRRYVYRINPEKSDKWIRLRQRGSRTTLAIKEIKSESIDGVRELNVVVDDFEKTNKLLNELNFQARAYQENKRISYILGDVKIEIDHWPKIPPFAEVEADSIKRVMKTVKQLGFDEKDISTKSVRNVYRYYGVDMHKFDELKF